MIILDLSTKSLEMILGGAVGTELPYISSYCDLPFIDYVPIGQAGTSNGATAVTIVNVPENDATPRQLKALNVYQPNAADVSLTLQYRNTADGSPLKTIFTITLKFGESLHYIDTAGFFVIDKNGNRKSISHGNATETAIAQQSKPVAATLTNIYTVPAATNFKGRIIIANQSAVATAFRLSIAPLGAADATSQYIAYDTPIIGNDIYESPEINIPATAIVRVYNTLATCSFSLTGVEKS